MSSVLFFRSVLKGTENGILIVRVTVDDTDFINGILDILEILKAVFRRDLGFFLSGCLIILIGMNAYDNSLLLFVDVSILAILALLVTAALMQSADLFLKIFTQRVLVVVGILLILVIRKLIYFLIAVGRSGFCILISITIVVL